MIAKNQQRHTMSFKSKLSQEYKDLVEKFLKDDPDERIPLIKVFHHPWVLFFQQKFFAEWQPEESSGEEEDSDIQTGSSEEEYDEEEAEDKDETLSDAADDIQGPKRTPGVEHGYRHKEPK